MGVEDFKGAESLPRGLLRGWVHARDRLRVREQSMNCGIE